MLNFFFILFSLSYPFFYKFLKFFFIFYHPHFTILIFLSLNLYFLFENHLHISLIEFILNVFFIESLSFYTIDLNNLLYDFELIFLPYYLYLWFLTLKLNLISYLEANSIFIAILCISMNNSFYNLNYRL